MSNLNYIIVDHILYCNCIYFNWKTVAKDKSSQNESPIYVDLRTFSYVGRCENPASKKPKGASQ